MSDVAIDCATLQRLQKLATLGETSAGTWHELRNLITAILGFTQLARSRGERDALHYLGLVDREAARCLELLEGQLDLARLDPARREAIQVEQLLAHVTSSTRYQAGIQRVTLHVHAQPLAVRAYRGELEHVLVNLVINALDAMPDGGEIAISCERAGDLVEIAVADTGSGVPPELRESIFQPFFTTKRGKGTGLGLAMCKAIVERHGGTIALDGERAGGARFVVRIPVVAC